MTDEAGFISPSLFPDCLLPYSAFNSNMYLLSSGSAMTRVSLSYRSLRF